MNWPRLHRAFTRGPEPGSWWLLDGQRQQALGTVLDHGSGEASVVYCREGFVWVMAVAEWRRRARRIKRRQLQTTKE